jgi:hypothetical protein
VSTPPLQQRRPFDLNGKAHPDVVDAIRYAFSGILDLQLANEVNVGKIAALKPSTATTAAATTTTTIDAAGVLTIIYTYVFIGGPTTNRPTSPANYTVYFDTTLGFPVWWTGSAWVDSAGMIS